jgi:hypothetical protein
MRGEMAKGQGSGTVVVCEMVSKSWDVVTWTWKNALP